MLKRVIPIALSLCMIFSAMTASAANEQVHGARQRRGERQDVALDEMRPMGERPSRDFAPPEGFTPPEGEFTPPEGFTPPQGRGTRTENSNMNKPTQNSENSNDAEKSAPKAEEGTSEVIPQMPENIEKTEQAQDVNSPFGGQMPEGMGRFPGGMQNNAAAQAEQEKGFWGFVKTNSTPITSVVLLCLAYVFVIFYRRKNY